MSSRSARIVLCLVAMLALRARAGTVSLSVGQTAINGSATGVGFADVSIAPSATTGMGFVNIVSDLSGDGNTSDDWLVHNFPVPLNPDGFGGGPGQFSFTYQLGSRSPSGALSVFSSFDAAPLASPNLNAMTRTDGVNFVVNDIDGLQDPAPGLAGGANGARVSASSVNHSLAAAAEPAGNGQVHNDIPGIKQGKNECGPISAAQSLLWLAKKKNLQGLPGQADLIAALKTAMGWTPDGVGLDSFVSGKRAFINTLQKANKPNRVTSTKGGASNGTNTFKFIKSEINDGEDVEMTINYPDGSHHLVTVAGFFDDGKTQKLFFKDPLTGGDGVDSYGLNGTTITDYKYGQGATIGFAVGESVQSIPLPGQLPLTVISVLGVMAYQVMRVRPRC